jgi:DNA-directed RNA polymerase sigma subunit (sigma70/sigma32)
MSSTLEPIRVAPETTRFSAAVPLELYHLLVSAGFNGRQLTALSTRLRLAGHAAQTLAVAGATAGLTRERVRQLECRLRDHVARSRPPLTAAALRGSRAAVAA